MRNIIITVSLLIVALVTACLNDVWAGFVYFSLSSLTVLCLYWGVIFIFRYREDYFINFQEDYKFYKINLINSSNLTLEDIEKNDKFYIKKFKKTLIRDKIVDIFKILLAFVFAIICIVAMSTGYRI